MAPAPASGPTAGGKDLHLPTHPRPSKSLYRGGGAGMGMLAQPAAARPAERSRLPGPRRRPVMVQRKSSSPERNAPDPNVFVLWSNAGRSHTPNSLWRAERGGQVAPADGAPRTLAAVVVGHQRPATSPAAPGTRRVVPCSPRHPSRLDGTWLSRLDGELRGHVEGGQLRWEEDGSATPLVLHGERGNIVSMTVDGQAHSGVLSADERLLRWGDGDVWVRVDDFFEQVSTLCSSGNSILQDDSLSWGSWRASSSRPPSRPASRPTSRSLYQEPVRLYLA
mmetsp:Transcript_35/g.115  ORF Transcript_35/g.115 Transcript_35/m.115 type:complete len:279 (-) Transcript_35:21-857(-)